jgi:hypothetical protein
MREIRPQQVLMSDRRERQSATMSAFEFLHQREKSCDLNRHGGVQDAVQCEQSTPKGPRENVDRSYYELQATKNINVSFTGSVT